MTASSAPHQRQRAEDRVAQPGRALLAHVGHRHAADRAAVVLQDVGLPRRDDEAQPVGAGAHHPLDEVLADRPRPFDPALVDAAADGQQLLAERQRLDARAVARGGDDAPGHFFPRSPCGRGPRAGGCAGRGWGSGRRPPSPDASRKPIVLTPAPASRSARARDAPPCAGRACAPAPGGPCGRARRRSWPAPPAPAPWCRRPRSPRPA